MHKTHDGDSRVEAVIYRENQKNHDEILFACAARDWREKRVIEVVE